MAAYYSLLTRAEGPRVVRISSPTDLVAAVGSLRRRRPNRDLKERKDQETTTVSACPDSLRPRTEIL